MDHIHIMFINNYCSTRNGAIANINNSSSDDDKQKRSHARFSKS